VHFLLLDSPEHCNIATAVLSTGHDIYCYQKYRIFLLYVVCHSVDLTAGKIT